MDKKLKNLMILKFKNTSFIDIIALLINEIDINEIVVSNKLPFGKDDFKHFIGYKDDKKIRPLCIFFPKMSTY